MLKIIKIGGNVVDNEDKLDKFLNDLSRIPEDKILIHGGGKIATAISKSLGVESKMIEGRRVTDAQTLDIVTMVYAGLVNKKIVASLQRKGVNAFGLCGADGATIISDKRSATPIDYGYVGDPDIAEFSVNTISMLISGGYTPVIAPITLSKDGDLLNTNADTVAQSVAVALSKEFEVELIYCFEKKGVLSDVNDENSVISHITPESYAQLKKDGIVADGMIPKLDNAFKAINCGVRGVVICSSDDIASKGGTLLESAK